MSYFKESGDDGSACGEDNGLPLYAAFTDIRKIPAEAPLDAEHHSDAEVMPVVKGDELSEARAKIYQLVISW